MEFHVVIPARYDSKRLPGKPLIDIAGKPMVQHVYERAIDSGAESVVIATDDERVAEVAEGFGAQVCLTTSSHESGTERLAEAVQALDYEDNEIVVNVQGDEPMIPPAAIQQVARGLADLDNVKIATMCEPITDIEELFDTNVVKVVLNRRHYAMYFSRATIPWERDNFADRKNMTMTGNHYRHVGLYAYRVSFLKDYLELSASPVESLEALEQLRVLWHGGRIYVAISDKKIPPGVDTEEDLAKVRKLLKSKAKV